MSARLDPRTWLRFWLVADPEDAPAELAARVRVALAEHVLVDVDPVTRACVLCGPVGTAPACRVVSALAVRLDDRMAGLELATVAR